MDGGRRPVVESKKGCPLDEGKEDVWPAGEALGFLPGRDFASGSSLEELERLRLEREDCEILDAR